MIGGEKSDCPLPASGADRLHLWDSPPKLIFVGGSAAPTVNSRSVDECVLRDGDVVAWHGARLVFHTGAAEPTDETEPAPRSVGVVSQTVPFDELQAWHRVSAGMLVELGLADSDASRRWRDAAARDEFDPDACARDVLGSSEVSAADPRVQERTARLMRELLTQPSASAQPRKVRGSARKGRSSGPGAFTMVFAPMVLLAMCVLLALAVFFVLRLRWGWSADEFLDRISKKISGG